MGQEQILKSVDGYLGQTSLQLHDNLFDIYRSRKN